MRRLEAMIIATLVIFPAFPGRFMWGMDLVDHEGGWMYDEDVIKMIVEFSREFIGQLKPEVQEKFAYKNAEKLFDPAHEKEEAFPILTQTNMPFPITATLILGALLAGLTIASVGIKKEKQVNPISMSKTIESHTGANTMEKSR